MAPARPRSKSPTWWRRCAPKGKTPWSPGPARRLTKGCLSGCLPPRYDAAASAISVTLSEPPKAATAIAVVSAGTSDMPVAEEAAVTAEFYGNPVLRVRDVGVAGLHRLLSRMEEIRRARVVVVVAGMEGGPAQRGRRLGRGARHRRAHQRRLRRLVRRRRRPARDAVQLRPRPCRSEHRQRLRRRLSCPQDQQARLVCTSGPIT